MYPPIKTVLKLVQKSGIRIIGANKVIIGRISFENAIMCTCYNKSADFFQKSLVKIKIENSDFRKK